MATPYRRCTAGFLVTNAIFSNQYVRMAIGIGLSVLAMTNPALFGLKFLGDKFLASAIVSAAYNGTTTLATGGTASQAFAGAIISFGTALIWHGVGDGLTGANPFERVAVHGLVGGGIQTMEGGNFADGFLSASVAEAAPIEDIKKDSTATSAIMERTAAAGVIGGTVAAASGGNFANGAKTAAFAQLFNDECHLIQDKYEASLRAKQQEVWEQNKQFKGALNKEIYDYVSKHGSLSLDLSVPVAPFVNAKFGLSASTEGYAFHFGAGPALGGALDVSSSANWSFGHESSGFTQGLYAEGGVYSDFGFAGSAYHSSAGYGAELKTGYIKGFVVGGELGYTTRRYWQ